MANGRIACNTASPTTQLYKYSTHRYVTPLDAIKRDDPFKRYRREMHVTHSRKNTSNVTQIPPI